LKGWARFCTAAGASSGVGCVRSMIPGSSGSRGGGFGGEEWRDGEDNKEGGGATAVAGGTKGLDWGIGFFAATRAGEAVCGGGFAIFGPGERCSAGVSAGRLAGIVGGTSAG
jgi:hypothetical protein